MANSPAQRTTPAKPAETEKKKTPATPAVEVAFKRVAPPSGLTFTPALGRSKPRSAYMLQLDELVKESRATGEAQWLICAADPKAIAELEKNIRRSGEYTGNGIRMGGYAKGPEEGTVYVSFLATERIRRPRKPKETTPETASETAPETAPDAGTDQK